MSLDIKITRQDLRRLVDIARLAERFNQSLVNLISKDANLVFFLSVNPLFHSSN